MRLKIAKIFLKTKIKTNLEFNSAIKYNLQYNSAIINTMFHFHLINKKLKILVAFIKNNFYNLKLT
jgi:hypothetical protein